MDRTPPFSPDEIYVEREEVSRRLARLVAVRSFRLKAVLVSGPPGVGKTTLLRQFISSRRLSSPAFWVDIASPSWETDFASFCEVAYESREPASALVVIDSIDAIQPPQFESLLSKILNYKVVGTLLMAGRSTPNIQKLEQMARFDIVEVEPFSVSQAESLFKSLLTVDLPDYSVAEAALRWGSNLGALKVLAEMTNAQGVVAFDAAFTGRIYDFSETIIVPSSEIISTVSPQIVSATEAIVERLRKQPESIFDLPPREFEELLADLLTDMGFEVELTKATRDGGKDILAYMPTGIGRLLCLVEAKRYKKDHKVGVDLVRSLYGTFCDFQANSAMLVTTSSFSKDAREFQQKHQYQLSLKQYGDVVEWVQRYKKNGISGMKR